QKLHVQVTFLQIHVVQTGNFNFTTSTWFNLCSLFTNTSWVEVKTRYSVVTLRMCWLFFNRNCLAILIKINHTKTFWIVNVIAKDGCLAFLCISSCILKQLSKSIAVKDIVAQNHGTRFTINEVFT